MATDAIEKLRAHFQSQYDEAYDLADSGVDNERAVTDICCSMRLQADHALYYRCLANQLLVSSGDMKLKLADIGQETLDIIDLIRREHRKGADPRDLEALDMLEAHAEKTLQIIAERRRNLANARRRKDNPTHVAAATAPSAAPAMAQNKEAGAAVVAAAAVKRKRQAKTEAQAEAASSKGRKRIPTFECLKKFWSDKEAAKASVPKVKDKASYKLIAEVADSEEDDSSDSELSPTPKRILPAPSHATESPNSNSQDGDGDEDDSFQSDDYQMLHENDYSLD